MKVRYVIFEGSRIPSNPSPRSASKKLASTLRSLSFKRREGLQGDGEHLQQPFDDPHQDLETAYVAQLCLTWEALHCQYTQLCQKISVYPENPTWCSHAAQHFQQFQVLLHRYIENEPFEQGNRVEIFARSRVLLPKLLQVPNFQGQFHSFSFLWFSSGATYLYCGYHKFSLFLYMFNTRYFSFKLMFIHAIPDVEFYIS